MTQKQKTHHIAVAAMLCAVAFVLQFIEFSIPLIPSFVKLDLSDLPAAGYLLRCNLRRLHYRDPYQHTGHGQLCCNLPGRIPHAHRLGQPGRP